jgi:hypothetical protein
MIFEHHPVPGERGHDARMDEDARHKALLALSIVEGAAGDAALAEGLGTHREAALAFSELAGVLLQSLAMHRGEDVPETTRFVRHLLTRA